MIKRKKKKKKEQNNSPETASNQLVHRWLLKIPLRRLHTVHTTHYTVPSIVLCALTAYTATLIRFPLFHSATTTATLFFCAIHGFPRCSSSCPSSSFNLHSTLPCQTDLHKRTQTHQHFFFFFFFFLFSLLPSSPFYKCGKVP